MNKVHNLNFSKVLEEYRGNIVDIENRHTISHDKLKELKNQAVEFLKNHGVLPLERVAVVMHSGAGFIINFFALLELGAVPVILSKNSTTYELGKLNDSYGISWVISDCLPAEEYTL